MRWLLVALACLLAIHNTEARILRVNVPRKQYVQLAMTFEGVTCDDVGVSRGARTLRNGARDSVKMYFTSISAPVSVIDSVEGLLDEQCENARVSASQLLSVTRLLASSKCSWCLSVILFKLSYLQKPK